MGAAKYILVMGVCGVGKSSVGLEIARKLGGSFVEADDLHSPENIALMRSGVPLDDSHRWNWLEGVASAAREKLETGEGNVPVVVACSALKATYRDFLRERLGDFTTVFLNGDPDLIHQRMLAREAHFMPPGLLKSQLAALEPPAGEAKTVEIDISGTKEDVICKALDACLHISNGDTANAV